MPHSGFGAVSPTPSLFGTLATTDMSTESVLLALSVAVVSFGVAFWTLRLAIPRLARRGIVGKDVHKPGRPAVAEMGGLFLVSGFTAGMVVVVAANTFRDRFLSIDLAEVLAVLAVVLSAATIGVIDDLTGIRQRAKAFVPLFIALPLVAVRVGDTTMNVPGLGLVDFGIVYSVVLVPLGVAGAANAVNMLAGFNGIEAGVGAVAVTSLAAIAYIHHETAALLVLIALLGALAATLRYNWYPSRVFIGDSGTFSIGAVIASAVIIGNFETAGIIVLIPYFMEFVLKARGKFPTKGWGLEYRDGKLFCPESGPVGVAQLIARFSGGTSERNIVLSVMALEAVFGGIAIWLSW